MEPKLLEKIAFENGIFTTSHFAIELGDIDSIKNLHLEETMKLYDDCLNNCEVLVKFTVGQYQQSLKSLSLDDNEKQRLFAELEYNLPQKVEAMRAHIHEQIKYIQECCASIYERRKRVTDYFNNFKQYLIDNQYITSNGRIKHIGYNIHDVIFNDLYHLLADALCSRFQLNQYDGKFRDGMYHCLQYLDYRFGVNDFSKQYPNATEIELEQLRRTNILDIITGRHNAIIDVQGQAYKCSAYLEEDAMFRLFIEEDVPWNISNASKKEFTIDTKKHSLFSLDERFSVKLDPSQMSYYCFIYEKPDMTIEQMFQNGELFNSCCNKCSCGSDKFSECKSKIEKAAIPSAINKIQKDFERELKKRISEINKKVCPTLGEAYTIKIEKEVDNNKYYIPISKNIVLRPDS